MRGSRISAPVGLARMLQIIVGAMTAGCLTFFLIVLALVGGPRQASETLPTTCLLSAMALLLVLTRLIAPAVFVARARRKIRQGTWTSPVRRIEAEWAKQDDDLGKMTQVLVSRTILAAAMLEGAVFLLLIAYFLEQSPISLVSAVLLLVALAVHIPTRSRLESWLDGQMRLLDEQRAF